MGNTLLRKVIFANIKVLVSITLPYRDNCLAAIFRMWFSIFLRVCCQFIIIVSLGFSEKLIPNISIYWCCSKVVIFIKFCFIKEVWSVFIGKSFVFSKLIVAPVAFFSFSKYLIAFWTDSCFFSRKLESSACWLIYFFFFYLEL